MSFSLILNVGSVPAKFKVTQKGNGIFDNITWVAKSVETGIIAPNQTIVLSWQIEWETSSESFTSWYKKTREILPIGDVKIKIDYMPINNLQKKYFTTLASTVVVNKKEALSKDTEILEGVFDWYIQDMN